MTPSIEDLVSRARIAFARAVDAGDPDREAAMLELGRRISDLGLRGAADHPAVQALIAETAPALDRLPLPAWVRALGRAVEPLTGDDEDYLYALWLRSEIEYWRDLYRAAAPDAVARVETADADEALAAIAGNYYLAEIPAGIPASHVWWHRHAGDPAAAAAAARAAPDPAD